MACSSSTHALDAPVVPWANTLRDERFTQRPHSHAACASCEALPEVPGAVSWLPPARARGRPPSRGLAAIEHGTLERRQAVHGVRRKLPLSPGRIAFCPGAARAADSAQARYQVGALRQACAPLMHAVHARRRVARRRCGAATRCFIAGHSLSRWSIVRPRHNSCPRLARRCRVLVEPIGCAPAASRVFDASERMQPTRTKVVELKGQQSIMAAFAVEKTLELEPAGLLVSYRR